MKCHFLQRAASVLVLSAMSATAAIRYVNVNGASPVSPDTNWPTAAMTIQDAVDAAVAGDQILVTNGVYQTGERGVSESRNRVAVTNAIMVRSVNGAAVTVIHGQGAVRCVYLANGAALVGFTLTNGVAFGGDWSGGGVERGRFVRMSYFHRMLCGPASEVTASGWCEKRVGRKEKAKALKD